MSRVAALRPHLPLIGGGALAVVGIVLIVLALAGVVGGSSTSSPPPAAGNVYAGKPATQSSVGHWRSVDPGAVRATQVAGPDGSLAYKIDLHSGRTTYTAAQWTFLKSQNFFGHRWLFLDFRGGATGQTYTVFLDFSGKHTNSAGFTIVDSSDQWNAVPLDLSNAELGKPPFDFRHVISVRLTTAKKDQTGSFEIGRMTLSRNG